MASTSRKIRGSIAWYWWMKSTFFNPEKLVHTPVNLPSNIFFPSIKLSGFSTESRCSPMLLAQPLCSIYSHSISRNYVFSNPISTRANGYVCTRLWQQITQYSVQSVQSQHIGVMCDNAPMLMDFHHFDTLSLDPSAGFKSIMCCVCVMDETNGAHQVDDEKNIIKTLKNIYFSITRFGSSRVYNLLCNFPAQFIISIHLLFSSR